MPAIDKAKQACQNAGEDIDYHFAYVRKMVSVGSGAERQVDDILLTRYRGIYPEQLPVGEDVKKVERRLRTEEKKIKIKKKL